MSGYSGYSMSSQSFDDGLQVHSNILIRRETEVLVLVLQGTPNRQIARQLGVVEETVKFHISNILEKSKERNA
jgi:DNA-binding NarL/FixJ family response regulator